VYDSSEDSLARFVFHTSFDDPSAPPDAPPRRSVEARAVAIWPEHAPPVFFDMPHSNNAARIRIWLALKGLPPVGLYTLNQIPPELKSAWSQTLSL
jgi:hypothetical protein